jgi:hypothetical protein
MTVSINICHSVVHIPKINWRVIYILSFFADDTSLYVIVHEQNYIQAADMLSTDLSHIHNWSQNWAIKFNPNKTESILFTRQNINNPPVYFGDMDNRVIDVNNHCHLGLDLQSNCKCVIM